jgi:membrane protease YdiL (CAAX protease family)
VTNTRRIQTVVGLTIALALPYAHLGNLGKRYSGLGPLWGGEVLWWALLVAILAYVPIVERKPLSTIGYRRPGFWDVGLGAIAAGIAIAGVLVILNAVLPALHIDLTQETDALYATPLFYRVLLVTRASVVEETAFRGYGFERIAELTGRQWPAALATFVLFTLAHYPGGGWGDAIVAAWGSLVFTALYLLRRNLWSNIICHWIADGTGFILVPMLAGHH